MARDVMSFESFANSPIFSKLSEIRSFSLTGEVPPISGWSDNAFSARVVDRIYESLRDVVQAAGFYFEDQLKTTRQVNGVAVEYSDDQFDFVVVCQENQISINRRGSRLSNFHAWYQGLMPSAQGILANVANILTEETHRKIDILRASYRFQFLIYGMHTDTGNRSVRNSEIMQKLLKGFPDENGTITDSSTVLSSLGRLDVDLSRWIGLPNNRRRLHYSVEAPGNQAYSSVWFSFSYIGESYTDPSTGSREAFDPNGFLGEYDQAYQMFLRDSAINGFLEWLMKGYYFRSTSGNLP